jgi:hypothetical protein
MNRMIVTGAAFALALALQCTVSLAAQQRSFVSTGGNDANARCAATPGHCGRPVHACGRYLIRVR